MERAHKRKQYFIDKNFQARFILKFCLVVIASSLLLGLSTFLLSRNSTTVAIENTKVMVKRTSDFILPTLVLTTLIVTVISAIVVVVLVLFISHKIAGPLYRLKREIKSLKDGDLKRTFAIRAKDQFKELASGLDEMSASLRQKHVELHDKWEALKQSLQQMNLPVSSADKTKLDEMAKEISQILSYFKI